jgi:dienelactone hydrolase
MTVEFPIVFHSQGVPLAARIFRNEEPLSVRQPGVISMGSWLTVKEQMATLYARRLAALGYTALVFDFTGFGESAGAPRLAEMPARKIADIGAAVQFMRTLAFVDAERIGCLAVCASAQYTLRALADGVPIQSFASVAGWFHDPTSIAPFYGGDAGIALRLGRARDALSRFLRNGEMAMAPAYREGDDRAGMHFTLDYYADPNRGAVTAWPNEMAEMTWMYWLSFDGLSAAARVSTPSVFVHSDGCAFPEHVKQIHAAVTGPKTLVWGEGTQTDYYDHAVAVEFAVTAVREWFGRTL